MVMAQCLLRALKDRAPDRAIDVMVPAATAPLATRMAEVRNVIEVPFRRRRPDIAARWRTARALRGRYDVAYVLPGSMKSALVPWLAGIPRRVGYRGEHRYGLINDLRQVPEGAERRTALLFRRLAGEGATGEPRLMVDEANRRRLCGDWRLEAEGFVALAPGAEYGPSKRWPAERFAALAARAMNGELAGRRLAVVLVGAEGDREICAAIRAEVPGVHDLSGATGLADAVDLLSAAALVVTNDSGLMHVAAALARPLVAVYGSTLPDHTPPLSSRAVALSRRLDCAPCFERACPLGHTDCLRTLDVDTVARAAIEALGAGRPQAPREG